MKALGILLFFFSFNSYSLTRVEYDYNPVEVLIGVKQATVLSFPEYIARIEPSKYFKISSYNKRARSTKTILVSTKKNGISEVIPVLLSDKTKVYLRLTSTRDTISEGVDDNYKLVPRVIHSGERKNQKVEDMSDATLARSLIAAMRENSEIMGFSAKDVNIKLDQGPVGDDLEVTLVKLYSGKRLAGYYVKVFNKSEKTYFLDQRSIDVGKPDKALVSHTSSETIPPGKKIRVLISSYHTRRRHDDIHLPIFEVKQ